MKAKKGGLIVTTVSAKELKPEKYPIKVKMEAKDMPIGVTCHIERDDNGQWWIVWGADFIGDESGKRLHPESRFLEEAYQAGKEEGIGEVFHFRCNECSTPNFIHLVIPLKKAREWGIK